MQGCRDITGSISKQHEKERGKQQYKTASQAGMLQGGHGGKKETQREMNDTGAAKSTNLRKAELVEPHGSVQEFSVGVQDARGRGAVAELQGHIGHVLHRRGCLFPRY